MTTENLETLYEIFKESSSIRFVYVESALNDSISRDRPYKTEIEITGSILGKLIEYSPSGLVFHGTVLDIGELEAYLIDRNIIRIPNECIDDDINALFINLERISKIISVQDFNRMMNETNGFYPFIYIENLTSNNSYEQENGFIAIDNINDFKISPIMKDNLKNKLFKYYETLGRYDIVLKLMDIFQ